MWIYSLGEIKKREEVMFAYLHGSFLEDHFRDIDIAIYSNTEKKNVLYALNLERELEESNITISSSIERFTGGRLLALTFDKEKITQLSSEVFDTLARRRERRNENRICI